MSTIETAVANIEASHPWKVDRNSIQVINPAASTFMANVMTTNQGDVGVPERCFAIHVVGGELSPAYAETIPGLQAVLAEREHRYAA